MLWYGSVILPVPGEMQGASDDDDDQNGGGGRGRGIHFHPINHSNLVNLANISLPHGATCCPITPLRFNAVQAEEGWNLLVKRLVNIYPFATCTGTSGSGG